MNALELTGRARTHVVALEPFAASLHRYAVAPFLALRRAAGLDGFDLRVASSFRDFDRQLAIWNAKYTGARALLDARGQPLDASMLEPPERVRAILRWSALPGASRHHWGTDLDLFDARAVPADYRVQLTPAEFAADGPFAALADWLERHAARFGFFRPFRGALSGVEAEPWHYSFAPEAETARQALTPNVLRQALDAAPLEGKPIVFEQLERLHRHFVASIDWP